MSNTIIIYFSQSDEYGIKDANKDNARVAAEAIRKVLGCDSFRVEFASNHPKDVWYTSRTRMKKALKGQAPLKDYLKSVKQYEHIFLCGPCWWGLYPAAIYSQLKKLNLDDKHIMCLVTHEGSNPGGCIEDIMHKYKNAIFGESFIVRDDEVITSLETIEQWALKEVEEPLCQTLL